MAWRGEGSAISDLPLRAIAPQLPAPVQPGEDAGPPFSIDIQDEQGCARFTARIIRNVTIKPSPEKIVRRLGLLDQRAINNAVDATNYTLWEMGKPTHVFDLDLLEGGMIVVRRGRGGEGVQEVRGGRAQGDFRRPRSARREEAGWIGGHHGRL